MCALSSQCPNCHKSNDTRVKGYWRQWEAFDCPDLDSIHNDGERHLSYIMMWPNTTRNKMAAWAGNQVQTCFVTIRLVIFLNYPCQMGSIRLNEAILAHPNLFACHFLLPPCERINVSVLF